MTNQPNPELDRRASVPRTPRTPLVGRLQPAPGRWRSIEAHAWLIVRSGHGLASEVTALEAMQSGIVDVLAEDDAARFAMRLDIDLQHLNSACGTCVAARSGVTPTLTIESTDVGPVAETRWALAGRLSSRAVTTVVDSELEVRDVNRRSGHDAESRFVVRTQVPVSALGLCNAHLHGPSGVGDHAELVTHLLTRRDATT